MSKKYMRIIGNDKVAATDGTWSQVTKKGKFVFISGQVPLDPAGDLVGKGDFGKQAKQALDNMAACLESAGARFENLMMITVFVTDMGNRTAFAQIRDGYFRENPPASTIVEINSLFMKEVLIEINGIALLE